jgi:hypothetical protein
VQIVGLYCIEEVKVRKMEAASDGKSNNKGRK